MPAELDITEVSDLELHALTSDARKHCLELQTQKWKIQEAWKRDKKPTPMTERVELDAAIMDARATIAHLKAEQQRRKLDTAAQKNARLVFWEYSDMLLAELISTCEAAGQGHLVKNARFTLGQRLKTEKN